MREYTVTITGKTPLLMHYDNIEWADRMEAWKKVPAHKAASKAGDDRTPPYRWLGSIYHDGGQLILPADNLMRCLLEGAAMVPTGKRQQTFRQQSQTGITPGGVLGWPLLVAGNPVPTAPLFEGAEQATFDEFQARAAAHGFLLFCKRARIGQSKHIRVRPRFDDWRVTAQLAVSDEQITEDVLRDIVTYAGRYKGLGDWRPSSKTPGPWGTFTAEIERA